MATAHWIAELLIDGRWHRWAAAALTITAADEPLGYVQVRAGLVSDVQAAQGDEVSLSVVDASVDWPTLADALERTDTRLRLWVEGTDYAAATVYSRGLSVGATYGPDRCSWDVQEDQLRRGLLLPDPQAQATAETWPILSSPYFLLEDQEGMFYPIIFGMPGYVQGRSTPYPVVPVPLVQWRNTNADPANNFLGISDRALPSTVSQVFVQNVAAGDTAWQDVTTATDGLGRKIGVADFTNDNTQWPGSSEEKKTFYVGFEESTGGGGGKYRGAHEVIMFLLRTWGAETDVDWARMQELEFLDAYKVDTWINAETRAWDWIEAVLVPQLPVVVRHSTVGRYLERDRYFATAQDAQGSLDAQRGQWERRSDITWADVDIANEIVADFRFQRTNVATARRAITAESSQIGRTFGTVDDRILGHPLCLASQARYGRRPADPIKIGWTWDEATVFLVLQDIAERRALPYREVTGWVRDGDDLRTGDVRLLTDSTVALADQVAIVAEPPLRTKGGAFVSWRLPYAMG